MSTTGTRKNESELAQAIFDKVPRNKYLGILEGRDAVKCTLINYCDVPDSQARGSEDAIEAYYGQCTRAGCESCSRYQGVVGLINKKNNGRRRE
jgi:hypothetical protein